MKNVKLTLVFTVILLFLYSCSISPEIKTQKIKNTKKIKELKNKSTKLLQEANKEFKAGNFEKTRELLNNITLIYFKAPSYIKQKKEFKAALTDAIDKAIEIEESIQEKEGYTNRIFLKNPPEIKISQKKSTNLNNKVKDELKTIKYSIPITLNKHVKKFIKIYTERRKESIELGLARSGKYLPMIERILEKYGLPDDLKYLPLLESNYRIKAISRAYAKGLWQFIRSTARLYGLKVSWWLDERYNPQKSTEAAAKFLKHLYNKFNDWHLALAAYDTGEGRISRALRRVKGNSFWDISKTRYIFRETRNYVPAFLALLIIAKDPERFNLKYKKSSELKYKTVKVPSPIDIRILAEKLNINYTTLREYNPDLLRAITPYSLQYYELKIPENTPDNVVDSLKNLPLKNRIKWVEHRVKRGETLFRIAKKYSVSVNSIKSVNHLRSNLIRPGQILLVTSPGAIKYGNFKKRIKNRIKHKKLDQKSIFYEVKKGDSLYTISRKYDISIGDIKVWNNLKTNRIYPGDRLIIYI